MRIRLAYLLVTLLPACTDDLGPSSPGDTSDGGSDDAPPPEPIDGLPPLDAPCRLDEPEPSRLLVTTTDFSTGALSVADLETRTVERDVALGSTDAVPFFHGDLAYVVHRFQLDYVDVLDPANGWASRAEHPIEHKDVASANPQCLAVGPDGLAYVPLFNAPEIRILDPTLPSGEADVGALDLRAFADADGNPEANHCFVCGSTLFVNVRLLDADYAPTGPEQLVAFDLESGRPYDVDPDREGPQGIETTGDFVKQLRSDPGDPSGHTLLALTTGIERIDLAAGTVDWAASEDAFADAGLASMYLPQSFDVAPDGAHAFVAAYDDDFAEVHLYRVGLDGGAPAVPEAFADGFDSVERTLEVAGDHLWYGSTRVGTPGLWIYDLAADPPQPLGDEPLSTGLPPYSVIGIP